MTAATRSAAPADVPEGALGPYMLVAFGLAWGLIGAFLAFPDAITATLGPPSGHHPLFILAVYAPAIAAILVVLRAGGPRGVGRFLSRLLLWRCSPGWAAFLVVGIPAIYLLGSAVKGNLLPLSVPFDGPGAALGAMLFMLFLGPVEEFGWRGVMLPLLQRRLAPIWAGLVLGLVWGLWHLPAFFVSGTPQSAWGLMPFVIGSVAVSVILAPLFNSSRGSILLAALFHFQLNNPLWPDAQPHDTVFFVAAAVIVVWLHRGTMFRREGAATRVIPV